MDLNIESINSIDMIHSNLEVLSARRDCIIDDSYPSICLNYDDMATLREMIDWWHNRKAATCKSLL